MVEGRKLLLWAALLCAWPLVLLSYAVGWLWARRRNHVVIGAAAQCAV